MTVPFWLKQNCTELTPTSFMFRESILHVFVIHVGKSGMLTAIEHDQETDIPLAGGLRHSTKSIDDLITWMSKL